VGRRWSLSRSFSVANVCARLAPSLIASFREAVPPPGLTYGLKSECEPRRRRRFSEEVMGDEHGTEVLAPC
jgi:hypothetical protein